MKVENIHTRIINASAAVVSPIFETLGSHDDNIWPGDQWPRMKLTNGLKVGSEGGHGPIKYEVIDYNTGAFVKFKFRKPSGFNGHHEFLLEELSPTSSRMTHKIIMKTTFLGYLKWIVAIRWLHDALIEDAFDKVENSITHSFKSTRWSIYVRLLRKILG